jgi:hypothetical protein
VSIFGRASLEGAQSQHEQSEGAHPQTVSTFDPDEHLRRRRSAEDLEAAAARVDDPRQADRLRIEAQAARQIESTARVLAALQTIEAAVGQVAPRTLGTLAERLGRAYGRAQARLRREEREAVRAAVRAALAHAEASA